MTVPRVPSVVVMVLVTAIVLSGLSAQEPREYYVRSGAEGNGTNWRDAYSNFPPRLQRGATYYVADGSYGRLVVDTADEGTRPITIRKATAADHGTDTGWEQRFGDDSAVFDSWTIQANYVDLDGQVGQWSSDLPEYVPYGFRVLRDGGNLSRQIQIGTARASKTHVLIRHVEAGFTNAPRTGVWGRSMDVFYLFASNVTLSHVWGHDGGRVIILLSGNNDNLTVERSVLERNGQAQIAMEYSPSEHSEIMAAHRGCDNITIRSSYVRDWRSTGGLVLFDQNKNFRFHGNVMSTGYFASGTEGTDQDGMITSLGAGRASEGFVYNNTFADIDYGAALFADGHWSVAVAQNNLFYNARRQNGRDLLINGANADVFTRSHNWYFGSGAQREERAQRGNRAPFVDRIGKDYRLAAPTNAGHILPLPFNVDPNGLVRGADGVWDRGAFEYDRLRRAPGKSK